MTFTRPTLEEIRARGRADLASALELPALLPNGILSGISESQALGAHNLHGHLAWLKNQRLPTTSDMDGVLEWANLRSITRLAATFASGAVTFSGAPGASVPLGTQVSRVDGALFETTASGTIAISGSIDITVSAKAAGAASNADTGTALKLTGSLVGVSAQTAVAAPGLSGGVDSEADEDFRRRVLDAYRAPEQGGKASDYVLWARAVPGVTRAWVYPFFMGQPWTVGVSFAVDAASYGPIPNPGDVALVQAAIALKRPVTAQVLVFAPTAVALNPVIQVSPNTVAVQAAVGASLRDMLRREGEPGTTFPLSKLREAISLADGEEDNTLVSPVADVVLGATELLVLGTPVFV